MRRIDFISAVVVSALLAIGFPAPVCAGGGTAFDRRTPVVKVYQDTHQAVVNIAGERLVSTSIWQGFDWPDMFDRGGPRYRDKWRCWVRGWSFMRMAT